MEIRTEHLNKALGQQENKDATAPTQKQKNVRRAKDLELTFNSSTGKYSLGGYVSMNCELQSLDWENVDHTLSDGKAI